MTRKQFLALPAGLLVARPQSADSPRTRNRTPATRNQQPATSNHVPRTFPAGATKAVVDFVERASIDAMPTRAIAEAKRCLIDGFGVVLAGSTLPGSAIVRAVIGASGGAAQATVLGTAMRATTTQAALANGASGHAMDYDDTQLSDAPDRVFGLLTHPTVPVLAASLAVAEHRAASGRAFLESFLVGFETECKIAEAIRPEHYVRGYHSTGTIGTSAPPLRRPGCSR